MARLTLRKPPPQKMQTGGVPVGGPTEDDITRTIQPIGQLTPAEQNLTQQFPNLLNLLNQQQQPTTTQSPLQQTTGLTGGAESAARAEAQDLLPLPQIPNVPSLQTTPLTPTADQTIAETGLTAPERPDVDATQISETGLTPSVPDRFTAPQVTTATVTDTGQAQAATQAAPTFQIGDIQEQLLPSELATAATETLDPQATVQFQLEQITNTIQEGQPLPPWAAPAARNADAFALQRGLGSSSMAVAARTQALLEAGVKIAATDAASYGRIQIQNLNNKQQAALQNANNLANMRTQNLNARMTAAVNNARNFLSIDTQNLNNQQASNTLSYNAFTNSLFRNQAAENVTRQTNAKSTQEVEKLFTILEANTETANANRLQAVRQFNAGQKDVMAQFNQNQAFARDTFNTQMLSSIRAANANWFRSIATIDNSNQMLANSFAAQSVLGLLDKEYNNLWQRRRDDAFFVFESAERQLDRQAQTAALAQQESIARSAQSSNRSNNIFGAIGSIVSGLF